MEEAHTGANCVFELRLQEEMERCDAEFNNGAASPGERGGGW